MWRSGTKHHSHTPTSSGLTRPRPGRRHPRPDMAAHGLVMPVCWCAVSCAVCCVCDMCVCVCDVCVFDVCVCVCCVGVCVSLRSGTSGQEPQHIEPECKCYSFRMCVYIYMLKICSYRCVYLYTYMYYYKYMNEKIYTHIHTCIHTYIHTYIHRYIYDTYRWASQPAPGMKETRSGKANFVYIYMYIDIDTYMYINWNITIRCSLHIYIYTYIYINTYTSAFAVPEWSRL